VLAFYRSNNHAMQTDDCMRPTVIPVPASRPKQIFLELSKNLQPWRVRSGLVRKRAGPTEICFGNKKPCYFPVPPSGIFSFLFLCECRFLSKRFLRSYTPSRNLQLARHCPHPFPNQQNRVKWLDCESSQFFRGVSSDGQR